MAITDYTTLKSSVQNYVARTDTTFSNNFDTFLSNAENHIYNGYDVIKELRIQNMVTEATVTVTDGVGSLPSNYLSLIAVADPTDMGTPLVYLSPQDFEGFSSGEPIYYTIIGNDIKVAPTFGGDISITYWAKYEALTDAAPSNYLIINHSDIYLQAVLIEAYAWLRDDAEEQKSTQRYKATINALVGAEKKKRYSSGALSRPRAARGFNTNADVQR